MGSVTNAEYVKIVAADAGSGAGGANIYVYSVSAFIGSYAQSVASYSASGVSNPSHMLQIPGSGYTNLQALSSGSSWINASLGTEYSGELLIYLSAVSGYTNSNMTVQYSSTGLNGSWKDACGGPKTVSWTSEEALACTIDEGTAVKNALYVKIIVTYSGGNAADVDVYGLYVA